MTDSPISNAWDTYNKYCRLEIIDFIIVIMLFDEELVPVLLSWVPNFLVIDRCMNAVDYVQSRRAG